MKLCTIVIPIITKLNKIITCFRYYIAVQLKIQGTHVGDQSDIALLLDPFVLDFILTNDSCFVYGLRNHRCRCETCSHHAR